MLRVGDRFQFIEGEEGTFEVTRVTPSGASYRTTRTRHVEILDDEGNIARTFDARDSRTHHISRNAHVRLLSRQEGR